MLLELVKLGKQAVGSLFRCFETGFQILVFGEHTLYFGVLFGKHFVVTGILLKEKFIDFGTGISLALFCENGCITHMRHLRDCSCA